MKQRGWLTALGATLALGSSALASTGGTAPAINWWQRNMLTPPVGWYLVDFVIFVAMLVYVGRKPLQVAFLRRHLTIKQTIADNEAALSAAERRWKEQRDRLAVIDREVTGLIARIKEDGNVERERIIAAGRAYATRLRQDAQAFVQQEAAGARERLRHDVASRVVGLAEAQIRRELTPADLEQLLESALCDLEDSSADTGGVLELRPPGRAHSGGASAVGGIK